MSTKSKSNRATEEQLFNRQIAAIPQYIKAPIQLDGETLSPAQLVAIPQAAVAALQAVDAAAQTLQEKRQAALTALATARTTSAALHSYLVGVNGKTSPVLKAFGFTPAAPVVVSVKTKAIAVAKGAATRGERHTMGPKQKEAVVGTLPATITLDVPGGVPAAAATPAAAPTAPTGTGGTSGK